MASRSARTPRAPGLPLTLLLLLSASSALTLSSAAAASNRPQPQAHARAEAFDCHVQVGGLKYDLTPLAGEHSAARARATPPSAWEDAVRFDLCADLALKDGVADGDQCPAGTRACLTATNKKGADPDRIVSVVPLAQTSVLAPSFIPLSSPQGLSLLLHGPAYPADGPAQALNVTLLCAAADAGIGAPVFDAYEGGVAHLTWSAPAACGFTGDAPPEDGGGGEKDGGSGGGSGGGERRMGSGLGWFFLLLILAFATYFGLGAYYNYSTYGATGADLIPHRDFWREVPYMFRDVVSHLCSSVRSRPERRGGYIAV